MQVREMNNDLMGHVVVLIEADNFPFYNGTIGTVEKDEEKGFLFNPALRSMRRQERTFYAIPLQPSDMIEPLF